MSAGDFWTRVDVREPHEGQCARRSSRPGLQWRGRWYSEASVERIVAARESAAATRARAEGAAEALREASREVPFAPAMSSRVHAWLRDRADRIARSDAAPHTGAQP